MQDTIIKGTGNSRSLSSVPNFLTLYPTYEAFAQALMNGTLPIDLGPLNIAGLNTKGTDLNKTNLLSDATAALYGKTAAATPDEIFSAIRPLITAAQNAADSASDDANSKCKIETGSFYQGYVYNNDRSTTTSKTLNFSFRPQLLIIYGTASKSYGQFHLILRPNALALYGGTDNINYTSYVGATIDASVSYSGNSITISKFNTNMNFSTYYYVAFG